MSVIKPSESTSARSIIPIESSQTSEKKCKKKILDEDTYTEEMERIVTRDFFPHVTKLKAQIEYLDALKNGDMVKLNQIQHTFMPRTLLSQCSSHRNPCDTPTFGTPSTLPSETPIWETDANDECQPEISASSDQTLSGQKDKKVKSLDQFLAATTSEDNASFEEIREKDAAAHRQKYPWLYKDEAAEEEKVKNTLALPAPSSSSPPSENSITWKYKNKNALMYVPDGVDYTTEEKLRLEKQQEVAYLNTRFAAAPFDEKANKEAIAEAASYQAKMKEGKVGIDGKEIISEDSPKVNGYGFVSTPSPEPGVCDTPLMTWGEIEGTPFRLDGSDTPLLHDLGGQQFKMPEIPARERIALSLADKVAKKKRQTKKDALRHAQSSWLTPSPRFGSASPLTPSEVFQSMSPAAQKLASGIHKNTDKALRASYTPSPLRTPQADRTPDIVHSSPIIKTPVESPQYKKAKISLSADKITQIPRRQKAQDFF